jgi:hypothetical protein
MVIWKPFFLIYLFRKSGEFGPFFSMENPLNRSKSYIFQAEICRNFATTKKKKKTTPI